MYKEGAEGKEEGKKGEWKGNEKEKGKGGKREGRRWEWISQTNAKLLPMHAPAPPTLLLRCGAGRACAGSGVRSGH